MSTHQANGRPLAEALGTPVVTSEGGILTGDTMQSSANVGNEQAPRHSLEAVNVGIMRFFEDFRAFQSLDAEAEVGTPLLCVDCGFYPAAWMLRCWTCNSKMRLPSC